MARRGRINPDNIKGKDANSIELVQRYISKYRDMKGPNARRNTRQAHEWFFKRIPKDTNLKAESVYNQLSQNKTRKATDKALIGRLFLFKYDAKMKDELPVWDAAPLVFFFNARMGDRKFGEKGVMYLWGINVHYLPPKLRLQLFVELVKIKNDAALRDKTRLKMSWQILQKLSTHPLTSHCVKVYRADHLRSELAEVPPQDWAIVIPMALAKWKNGGKREAWKIKRG